MRLETMKRRGNGGASGECTKAIPSRISCERRRGSAIVKWLIICNSFGGNERNKKMASIRQAVIASPRIKRLRDFVVAFSHLVETAPGEPEILRQGSRLLKELV